MANTYNVQLKQAVFTLHDATTITVADSVQDGQVERKAESALSQFKNGEIVEVKGADDTTYIPFHAVIKVVVTETESTITKGEDDFCQPITC